MPLFRIASNQQVYRINSGEFAKERQLQKLVEANLLEVFGVRFIASEFAIRGEQAGRIDTLGLDMDNAPTLLEYKRSENENVINQGLYYMNWLLDHRGDFVVAARDMLGHDVDINWNNPRLIILAQSFAKWDHYAVRRMGEGIELWSYTLYGDDLLHLELVFGQPRTIPAGSPSGETVITEEPQYSLDYHLHDKPDAIQHLFYAVRDGIFAWEQEEGEIIETPNKLYVSYRHGKNFAEIEPQARGLKIHIDIQCNLLNDPQSIARDVSTVGHWGTGDTEIRVNSADQVPYVLELIHQAYRQTL